MRDEIRQIVQQHGRLGFGGAAALFKEWLVRPVIAEFDASHKPRRHLVFASNRDFAELLFGSSREPIDVVEKFKPS